MQKILFLSTIESFQWGGSEQLWSDMALQLLDKGYEVMTNTLEWPEPHQKIKEIKQKGGLVTYRTNIHQKLSLKDAIANKISAHRWRHDIIEFDPDIIFVNQGGTFDNALAQHGEWILSLNKPTYCLSNFMPEYGYEPEAVRNFFASFFQKMKQVWFVSNRSKEVCERVLLTKLDNAIVIKNPIKVKATPNSYADTATYKMAAVARLEVDVKGFDILISTFGQPQWKDRNFQVNIYGTGMHEDYLKKLAEFYNISDKIIFKGFVNDVVQLWEDNHLLLLSSRGEGTPLSLLEANYCKRAAVVTDVGGNADVIKDGYNGFVADAPTVRCFSAAMERAWEKREQWQQMGENARTNLDENHTTDAVGDVLKMIGITD